nr:la-related protein 7 [Megalopta genalis]XP_033338487.1 la-related protein 7 [Megalopta genalis]XP_033338488.1 la-related protein 7 [Megalopta genalis]
MVMEEQQTDMELDSERVPVPQVQKTVEDSHVETVNNVTNVSRGKPRLRKKALHAAILKQMEFYFSDASLSKDRFLSSLINNDPYVDLNVFVSFNKIRELTTDINRINKAIQSSTMLSTSEDGTKVRRITPIMVKENTDECTVYVQNLPPDADHEMLSGIFSAYGTVEYVSVPRYKQTKKIKGFAFVEFDTPESATKCLKAFQEKGCVLPSHTTPDELLSITTFDDADKDVTMKGRQIKPNETKRSMENTVNTSESECAETENKTLKDNEENITLNQSLELHENKDQKKGRKRKHQSIELPVVVKADNEVTNLKRKFEPSTDMQLDEVKQNNETQNDVIVDGILKKSDKCKRSVSLDKEVLENSNDNKQMVSENNMVATVDEQKDTNEKKKKKKKKRKRSSKTEDISMNMVLQVMAKKEWKYLRNKYLELQKSKMKQLKQHLRKPRWNQWSNHEKNKPEKDEATEKEKTNNKQENTVNNTRSPSFTPGVIVKIEMNKPCTDTKGFKMELKGNSSVKYIDINEGSFIAFVRCDTSEAAQSFAQKSNEERHMTILKGEDEQDYWNKISLDREEKLGKKTRLKQRGRTKLLKKAEKELGKHIKFDEV